MLLTESLTFAVQALEIRINLIMPSVSRNSFRGSLSCHPRHTLFACLYSSVIPGTHFVCMSVFLCKSKFKFTVVSTPAQARPVGSHNTNFATRKDLLAPLRPVNQMESVPLDDLINLEGPGGSPGSDLMRSWFSGFLRSREIAEIDRAIRGADADAPADEQPPHNRPWGPLQVGCFSSSLRTFQNIIL